MKKNKYYYLTKTMSKQAISILPALIKLSYYTKKQNQTGLNDDSISKDMKNIVIKLLKIMQNSSQVYYEALNDLSMLEADDIQRECDNRALSIEDFNDKIHEMKDFCFYQLLLGAISDGKEITYNYMYKSSDILSLILSNNNESAFIEITNAFGIDIPDELNIYKSSSAANMEAITKNRSKLISEYHKNYIDNNIKNKLKLQGEVKTEEVVDLFTKTSFVNM